MDSVETQVKGKILVVDDDEDVGECYVFGLTDCGFIVDYSPDGLAIKNNKITDYNQYLGIVMDYALCGCLGTSGAKWIKEQGYNGKIVLNTGYSVHELIKTEAIDCVFQKPSDAKLLAKYFLEGECLEER